MSFTMEQTLEDGTVRTITVVDDDRPADTPDAETDLAAQLEAVRTQLATALEGLAAATSLAQVRNAARAAQG